MKKHLGQGARYKDNDLNVLKYVSVCQLIRHACACVGLNALLGCRV